MYNRSTQVFLEVNKMKAQCMICDDIVELSEDSLLAKRLKYNRIKSYLCDECYTRIKEKTLKKHASGNFHLYQYPPHRSKKHSAR